MAATLQEDLLAKSRLLENPEEAEAPHQGALHNSTLSTGAMISVETGGNLRSGQEARISSRKLDRKWIRST